MSGLFETIRVRNGQVPFLASHLRRLSLSRAALGHPAPPHGLAERILQQRDAGEAVVRVTLDERGERIEPRAVPPCAPMRIVFSGTMHEPYPHKLTRRLLFDRARMRVVPYRADEVLLLTREGYLAEGCVTSIFFWMGEDLCTPALDLGILPGVGRERLIALAGQLGIPVREGHFNRAVAAGLPLFLVNSVRGIVDIAFHGDPHRQADDRTRRLAEAFWG